MWHGFVVPAFLDRGAFLRMTIAAVYYKTGFFSGLAVLLTYYSV